MSTTCPIRKEEDLQRFKNYYLEKGNMRNYLLIVVGLNTALRIGDVLKLKWEDVYDEHWGRFRRHLHVVEQKTGKQNYMARNTYFAPIGMSTSQSAGVRRGGSSAKPPRKPGRTSTSAVIPCAKHLAIMHGNRAFPRLC